jgi:hypothetical protein
MEWREIAGLLVISEGLGLYEMIERSAVQIAQAVSRWLSTAAARVRARVWSSGICD